MDVAALALGMRKSVSLLGKLPDAWELLGGTSGQRDSGVMSLSSDVFIISVLNRACEQHEIEIFISGGEHGQLVLESLQGCVCSLLL